MKEDILKYSDVWKAGKRGMCRRGKNASLLFLPLSSRPAGRVIQGELVFLFVCCCLSFFRACLFICFSCLLVCLYLLMFLKAFPTIALCVFEKRGPKMSNFELLFLHGFSSKNREIFHKAVLTPQEYEDYFLEKKRLRKKWGKNQKTCWLVFPQVKIGLKKILSQKEFFF